MKIGLLTLPLHTNIGGILQAYALQNVLERQGHSVVMLVEKLPLIKIIKQRIKYFGDFIKGKKKSKDKIDSEEIKDESKLPDIQIKDGEYKIDNVSFSYNKNK